MRSVQRLFALVRRRLRARRLQRRVDAILAERPGVPPGTAEVVLWFADGKVNLYQLRQWYAPLRELDKRHRVVIVTRAASSTLAALEESGLAVVQLRRIGEYEQWLATQRVRAVLYVNQNVRNFSAMRFAEPAHVFICHGESDKAYMASNQMKAYDHVLVAGQAAVERLRRNLVGLDTSRLLPVGRPQIDVAHEAPELPQDGRTVVLYAPTWEGDRPSMSYSSVVSHGEPLLRALLATGRHRVVLRPHPRTGVVDPGHRRALSRLCRMVEEANRRDPGAAHLVDTGAYGWQLQLADFCVTDVSAVAFDWLATGKPFRITRPVAPEAVVDPHGLVGSVPLLDVEEVPGIVAEVDRAVAEGPDEHLRALTAHYFGDTSPGSCMRRFLEAVDHIVTTREAALQERAAVLGSR